MNEVAFFCSREVGVDCVVMVLASMHYDEADYIRNYDDFMKVVSGK